MIQRVKPEDVRGLLDLAAKIAPGRVSIALGLDKNGGIRLILSEAVDTLTFTANEWNALDSTVRAMFRKEQHGD